MPASFASRALTSVDLPAPEGATTRKMFPANVSAWWGAGAIVSLQVLDLLAHLLDQQLQFHCRLRHFDRGGLRSERVGLAIQLLHEEVEPSADGSALGEDAADLVH